MDIQKAGSRPTRIAPPTSFTGKVMMEPIINAPDPARIFAVHVTFAPEARTFWHSHEIGQTLWVTHGIGRVQTRGGPVREIRAGDTVWFAPGEEHWHGAAPDHIMSHFAMAERESSEGTSWLDPVSDEDYNADPAA